MEMTVDRATSCLKSLDPKVLHLAWCLIRVLEKELQTRGKHTDLEIRGMIEDVDKEMVSILICDRFHGLTAIEQMMFLTLQWGTFFYPKPFKTFKVDSQVQIGPYRVDHTVTVDGRMVIVECDGHEYHEKTKEQAEYDKKRDRYLISNGYTVLHFTGREIWRNPYECSGEVWAVLVQQGERCGEAIH